MAGAVKVVNVENLTDEERGRLVKALKETSNSLARAEGEQEYVREAIKKIADDLKLPKKTVTKLVKVHHKQNFDEECLEHEQFEKLYKIVTK
jgi:hypothetical protein